MEFLYIILGVSLTVVGYFVHKFIVFSNKQKISQQLLEYKCSEEILKYRTTHGRQRMQELNNNYKKTNVFREMAIEQIAKQKLVYDDENGCYIRLKQIN